MLTYHQLLETILQSGTWKDNRTGIRTKSIFGYQMRFDLSSGFPLLTTKATHFHSILHELLWFIQGNTNIQYLKDNKVRIWDEWADEEGNLGPVYGKQWRDWLCPDGRHIDQLKSVIEQIQENPDSRRLIVSAWNPADIDKMALPPCHTFFQFNVCDGKLDLHLYQRSADAFLGVPFNIASYSLLLMIVANITDLIPGTFVHTLGDAHLYENHVEQTEILLKRTCTGLPSLRITEKISDIDNIDPSNIVLEGYNPHPRIIAKVAV